MALSWYPGKTSIEYTHSKEPLILPSKSGSAPSRALPELIKDVVPDCTLNPLLFNGHLQTFWTASNKGGPPIHYKRRTFESSDSRFAGHYTVDLAVAPPKKAVTKAEDGGPEDEGLREDPVGVGHHRLPPRTTYFTNKEFENLGSEDTKPLIIALHGLSGGSYEVYLRHVLAPLVVETAEGEGLGGLSGGDWEALVVNSRGCAGSKITSSILYNARATWDMRQTVKWCRETWPKRPLYAIGFSLGANILANVCSLIHTLFLHTLSLSLIHHSSLSISEKKVPTPSSPPQSWSQTLGNSRSPPWSSVALMSVSMSILPRWVHHFASSSTPTENR